MKSVKSTVKGLPFYPALKRVRRDLSHSRYERQGTTTAKIGDFEVHLPSKHPLREWMEIQPYRDVSVGIAAKYLGSKYPDATILDIGANVGDTAAHIATNCKNDLILVEPSDFFRGYLERNAALFPNRSSVESVFISPEETMHGRLVHWAGTAYFEADALQQSLNTKKLSDFDQVICMVKIDTDGHDFAIINGALPWLEENKPGVLFENQIRSKSDLEQADATFDNLTSIGYCSFAIFDAPGFFILSTKDIDILKDLNRYQYSICSTKNAVRTMSNYDVIAMQARDEDAFEAVVSYFKSL